MSLMNEMRLKGMIANSLRTTTVSEVFKNPDRVRQEFASCGEKLIRNYFKGNIRHGEGYDVEGGDGRTKEVKSTGGHEGNKWKPNGSLAVGGLYPKQGKCDDICIVDFANERVSVIPNEVFFKQAELGKAHKGSFRWDINYHPKRKGTALDNNTKLFKEYEIDAKKEFIKLGVEDLL